MGVQWNLQQAVYNTIKTPLAALTPTVPTFDDVPQDQAAPYVRVGEMTEVPWDADDFVGRETTITVHSWSTYRGMKEIKDIMDTIKATLHNQQLTVTGETFVLGFMEFSQAILESDGLTRHGVQRFRFITSGT
jgi:hypothetical protein